ncbi:MAG: bifunctional riboflavin kinase/FAD synthetase [Bacteroidetes bacterium]|nr:bifunctional riboflavin kinase/FAD synthetase [Bacteroidota bacterium]MBS1629161.1 bifunctional riboflavin kinase/FAD synthetase [Bacteroidota bacterium]
MDSASKSQPKPGIPVITIGSFDGVHLGHRAILDELNRSAQSLNGESVVITFEPHPRSVLRPDQPMQLLTPLEDKLSLLQAAGVSRVVVTPFTLQFAQLSAEDYVRHYLVAQFHPAAIVVGYDHRFGHDRCGDMSLLCRMAPELGFEVHEIAAHIIDDAAVSSTKIRKALLEGNVHHAADMLGRYYSMQGTVVHGDKLGRELGYPTANISPLYAQQLVPARGIYAVLISIGDKEFPAMASIGTRPTVSDAGRVSIEAHLFDFDADLYGQNIRIAFVKWLRDELKFESMQALQDALQEDELISRDVLRRL